MVEAVSYSPRTQVGYGSELELDCWRSREWRNGTSARILAALCVGGLKASGSRADRGLSRPELTNHEIRFRKISARARQRHTGEFRRRVRQAIAEVERGLFLASQVAPPVLRSTFGQTSSSARPIASVLFSRAGFATSAANRSMCRFLMLRAIVPSLMEWWNLSTWVYPTGTRARPDRLRSHLSS